MVKLTGEKLQSSYANLKPEESKKSEKSAKVPTKKGEKDQEEKRLSRGRLYALLLELFKRWNEAWSLLPQFLAGLNSQDRNVQAAVMDMLSALPRREDLSENSTNILAKNAKKLQNALKEIVEKAKGQKEKEYNRICRSLCTVFAK